MSEEISSPNHDSSGVSNRFTVAIQGSRDFPQVSPHNDPDPYTRELAQRVDAQTTIESKVRLLLSELQSAKLPGKGRVVRQLSPIFHDYIIPNPVVTQAWAEAAPCLKSPFLEIRAETLIFMGRCIALQRKDLHAWQRANYYDIIQRYTITAEELLFLGNSLYLLLEDGRNVEGVSHSLLNLLARWLMFCSINCPGDCFRATEFGARYRLLFFIAECVFQYSYDDFEDQDLTTFFDFLCNDIATKTAMLDVVDRILLLVEIISSHQGVIPPPAISHIIGFMCLYVSRTRPEPERFWKVMQYFLSLEDAAHHSLKVLKNTFSTDPALGAKKYGKYRIRGALIFMGKILEAQKARNDFKATLSLTAVLQSIALAVNHPELNIKESAISLLSQIMMDETMTSLSFEAWEIVWDALQPVLRDFNEIIKAFQMTLPESDSSTSSKPKDKPADSLEKQLTDLAVGFQRFCVSENYQGSLSRCVTFQLSISRIIDFPEGHLFILNNYEAAGLCLPGNLNWLSECEVILHDYACNPARFVQDRIQAVDLLLKPISFVAQDNDPSNDDFYKRIVVPLFQLLKRDPNTQVCKSLIRIAVEMSLSEREQWVIDATKPIYACAIETAPRISTDNSKPRYRNSGKKGESNSTKPAVVASRLQIEAAKGLVAIFENSLSKNSPTLSQKVFADLVQLTQRSVKDTGVRLEAMEALLRLRADSMYSVYITNPLPRHNDKKFRLTYVNPPETSLSDSNVPQDNLTDILLEESPESPTASSASADPITNGIHVSSNPLVKNPLKTFDDHVSDDESGDEFISLEEKIKQKLIRVKNLLPISTWLEAVHDILGNETDWSVYYLLLAHFPSQLMNKSLFAACSPQIIRIRKIVCELLQPGIVLKVERTSKEERLDAIARLHHVLTILIGYGDMFVKPDKDDIVRCFQTNMGRHSPLVTTMCIHSLMVSCYEFPKAIARCLSGILQALSHHITNPDLSVHILEFLVGCGRIPKIHHTFTADEFRMVLQVALKYLQHIRQEPAAEEEVSERMSQYIVYLAYEALTVWFLAVKLENRRAYVSWMIRKLILANGTKELDDQAIVFVDMLERFSFADSPLKKYPDAVEVESLAQYKKHWVVGRSVHTAQVVREDGLVKITVRKPASMLVTYLQAEVDFDSDAVRTGRKRLTQAELNTLPSYMITQMHTMDQPPITLSDDEATLRSIRLLDRMPVVNFHTIGITYVGWGQKTEEEILSNEMGSPEYQRFLDGIGSTVRLKGNSEIYHGGLDVVDDQDGTHTYFWSDKTTQITFITYTMIPLNKEGDRRLALSNKKRNAANCFVNIIWNDSNSPYSLDTMPSEFNSNCIVISRLCRTSARSDSIVSRELSGRDQQFFKVRLVQTPGMPEISPIMSEKILSEDGLPSFIRSVSLKLSIFCQIYIGRQEKSHWVARLNHIRQIRDRALAKRDSIESSAIVPRGSLSPSPSYTNTTLSGIGRRVVSTEVKMLETEEDNEHVVPLMKQYDFSKYT